MITVDHLDPSGLAWAQAMVTHHHYRHAPVDERASPEGWAVCLDGDRVGCFIVDRPEATRNYPWYGSVADVAGGKAEVTRWEVLNLARVWLDPAVQPGGDLHAPELLPGFADRRGVWRSTLASAAIALLVARVGFEYLLARPPCFIEEPYAVRWLMSYCDTTHHRGVIYRASGFSPYPRGNKGRAWLQTWRLRLPPLTTEQDAAVREAARISRRSQRKRAGRDAGRQVTLAF